jgi:hypothetical protein
MRVIFRTTALLLAAVLLLGLTVSCDEETATMRFDQEQYTAAEGENVQLRFMADQRRSQGCMLIPQGQTLVDQTMHVEAWKVEPADGASVDSAGRFTATEAGEYTVTATFSGIAYNTKVVVDAEGGTTVEEPEQAEPEAEDPPLEALAGNWSWTGALESNGTLGPGTNVYTYTFRQEGAGYALYFKDTRLCDVSFDGTNVTFSTSVMGAAEYNGVLSGNTITGTQTHEGGRWVGEWVATRQ